MADGRISQPSQRWVALGLLAAALVLTGRSVAIFLANALPLQLVLGSAYPVIALALVCGAIGVLFALAKEWKAEPDERTRALSSTRWAFTSIVAGAAGFLVLVDPFQRLWFDLALGLTAGGFAAFVLAMSILHKHAPKVALALDLVTFSVGAGLLGLEISLRAWAGANPSPTFARVGGGPSELVRRFRCKPGEVRFGFACNSAGYYDEEFYRKQPGEPLRVASIGDSFSVGTVPHAWHYTTMLEELSGYQVDNFGVAGIGPREYLSLLVEEALPLAPDLILISVFVGNDLSVEDVLGDLPDSGLRAWLQRDQVLLSVLPDRIRRLRTERERFLGRASRQARGGSGGTGESPQGRAAAAETFPWVLDPTQEEPSLAPETFFNIELARALEICAQEPPSIELLKSSLLSARQAAGDIPLVVMLIPDEFQVEDELWRDVQATANRPLDRDRPQQRLLRWFEESGIPVLDLLPVLRAIEPLADGKRHVYHALDTHFNARGNEAAAQALAPFLVKVLEK